uniref:adenosylmethionine decarboxylase n=1 Tax=Pyramimonas obovata TaxID=1411642 RepID=A0A7S0RQX6_9CHLO|mmetsp:Transcript_4191/g.8637  ORF Transcript_4191/g.8637 Transcript_4191/m.8637 type:complete len:434 (+) Transcript_4191:444-1745(+)|eukprot:CAMPEP_0118926860 /NCGR_PEP_ID=MMETSP1169-20130426/4471_1 /TAXON_ID=36882 /ORGANISM="Pyramimonas obovata, Strain CCMP722" /LENGTH=433 /DNA_ID=CAMNT_0006868509 /DNA_START=427 /DNA_END=1728 /DNA_ORIENTATION=-
MTVAETPFVSEKPSHAADLPGFEGSEKRVELDFYPSRCATYTRGLRHFTREQLDELMTLAQCEIVSHTPGQTFDAYVLSESSLFVYAHTLVIKTCGTTKLLGCVERLLEFANALQMSLRRVKYTRASYKYPEVQPFPHQSFEQEIQYLDEHFSTVLRSKGSAYVLGNSQDGLQWHVYVADAEKEGSTDANNARVTVEICMTGLSQVSVEPFWHKNNGGNAVWATKASGIRDLLAKSKIDDFAFEPCGYSMNGLEGDAFNTIHITPEDGFSYASLELCGYQNLDIPQIVNGCAKVFNPQHLAVAVSTDLVSVDGPGFATDGLPAPADMLSSGCTYQTLGPGGATLFCTYNAQLQTSAAAPMSALLIPSTSDLALAIETPAISEQSILHQTSSSISISSETDTPTSKKPRTAESTLQSELLLCKLQSYQKESVAC